MNGATAITSVSFSGGGGCGSGSFGIGLFSCSIVGTQVGVGVLNATALNAITGTSETQTATITTPSGTTTASVRLEIITGGGGQGGTFSPASLTENIPVGSAAFTRTVSILSSFSGQSVALTGVQTTSGIGWLQAALNGTTTPTSMTLTLSPSAVGTGTHVGYVNLVIGGVSVQYAVTMNVGTAGTGNLTFSENPVNFTYTTGQTPVPRVVQVFAPGALNITAVPQGACVVLDGGHSTVVKATVPTTGSNYANFSISFDPNAAAVSCTGTVSFISDNGGSNTLTVTVNTAGTGLLSLSQTALSFSYPSGVLQQQIVTSSPTSTASYVVPTVISGTNWLSVSPTSAYVSAGVPGTFTFSVYPSGLTSGTYSGQVRFSATGGITDTRYVNVTLIVGTGTGTGGMVAPQSLTYTVQAGRPAIPQSVHVQGVTGSSWTASFVPNSGSNWFILPNATGPVPGDVQTSVNPSGLTAGTSYTGTLTISTTSGSFPVSVTLNVVGTPVIQANPGSIIATATAGSINPITRYLDVSSSQPGTEFAFSVSTTASWITVSPNSGTTPRSDFQVALNPSGLTNGTYTGNVTISAPSAGNPSLSIPVVLVVGTGGSTGGFASPGSLSFTGTTGSTNLPSQSVYVNTTGASVYTVSTSNAWITVNPTSGYIPGSFAVTVSPSGLSTGTTSGSITVTAGGMTQTIPVTVSLTSAGGNVTLSPTALSFDYSQGDATPAVKTVSITSNPTGVAFTTSSNVSWLTATPASGTAPSTLSVGVNPSGLAVGTHTGTITVTPTGGAAVSVSVTLQVRTAAQLRVNPSSLSFAYRTGTGAPAGQTVQVGSTGSSLGFNASTTDSWIRISPTTGTTPSTVTISADPTALTPGSYTGTVTFSSTGSATPSSQTVSVTLSITGPLPTVSGVSNAASYVGNSVSPGEIVFISGTGLGPEQLATATPSGGSYPTTVSNTRVLFNGVPGAMIYTRTDQVSAVVPFSVGARAEVGIQVEYLGQRSNVVTMPLVSAMPGIFTLNASGTGPGAILNQDYSVNGSGNGAAVGSVIAIYATGGGQTFPASRDNAIATDAARTVLAVQAFIGGREAEVLYAGAAPQLINGALQVNARVPSGLSAGMYDLVIRINNVESRAVQVVVR